MVWVETPSNPLLNIVDIRKAAAATHAVGAMLVVDNTFATPYLQQPLALGADAVVHSTTKYLGGHSDTIGGFVATNDDALGGAALLPAESLGAVPGPLDAWLVLRGIKTLAVRMRQHCENARRIAEFLEGHGEVARVLYPGLPSHPGHAVARTQMRDFGGMISFLAHSDEEAVELVARTKLFQLAESLGGVESPDRASGADDARLDRRRAVRAAGEPRAPVGRHRVGRRPDRRSRRGARHTPQRPRAPDLTAHRRRVPPWQQAEARKRARQPPVGSHLGCVSPVALEVPEPRLRVRRRMSLDERALSSDWSEMMRSRVLQKICSGTPENASRPRSGPGCARAYARGSATASRPSLRAPGAGGRRPFSQRGEVEVAPSHVGRGSNAAAPASRRGCSAASNSVSWPPIEPPKA